MSDPASHVVSVQIHGRHYAVRSSLDAAYVLQLAAYVDQKMQDALEEGAESGDPGRVAVLAALNIADEYFRCQQDGAQAGDVVERTAALERLLDRALAAGS